MKGLVDNVDDKQVAWLPFTRQHSYAIHQTTQLYVYLISLVTRPPHERHCHYTEGLFYITKSTGNYIMEVLQ